MKTRRILLAAALVALMMLPVGCKKYSFTGGGNVHFKVSTQTASTKTAYSGEVVEGKERINWLQNDRLAIFMMIAGATEEESSYSILDYTVKSITTAGAKSIGTVEPVGEAHQWGEGTHAFAALYPSPRVDANWANEIDLYKLKLTYPAVQTLTPKGTTGADALTLLPDMKYAYLFAFPQTFDSSVGTVTLSLEPVFTAYEISISAGDNDVLNLTGFRLKSNRATEPIAGVKNLWTREATDESTTVSVDLSGIQLTRDGAPLVFTVFTYGWDQTFHSLTLEFTGTEIGTRTLDLKQNGEWISFAGCKKHKISGLDFPALDEGTAGGQGINWNGTVSEDIYWYGAEGEDINWGGNKPLVLPGKFSISETEQVQFARGNLIYKGGKWDFHKQQYDRCFKENGPVELSETATFDLFGWATAGIAASDATMKYYQPWSFNTSVIPGQEITNPYGFGPSAQKVGDKQSWNPDYCDWGNNYKLKECLGSGWFTMSAYEWEYMLQDRAASTVNGKANARFAKAKVNGLPGLLIFPDTFGTDYAGDQSIFTAVNINNSDKHETDYDFINLSLATWKDVEAAGAVFLAPTGVIFLEEGQPCVYVSVGDMYINFYWSSTCSYGFDDHDNDGIPDDLDSIFCGASVFGCEGTEVVTSEDGALERHMPCAVRLVRLAE